MISIVAPYFNRRELLVNTLKSIEKSAYKDIEFIVVDDASDERIDDLYYPFLRILRIEPEDKWYHNSCIPFNIGIREAKGDIIILQNPECYHVHDVLSYVAKTVDDTNYVSMSCYSISKDMSLFDTLDHFLTLPQQSVIDYVGWYNHSIYRPVHYHFCSAITKQNLNILGGFDERYAHGTGYEDDDLIDRVKRWGLELIIATDVSVIHQWHPKIYDINIKEHHDMFRLNGMLHRKTKTESIIHVND